MAPPPGNKNGLKHGLCHTPEYGVWRGIKQRCQNPSDKDYKNYGGRGIRMCDRWFHSVAAFYDQRGAYASAKEAR
jgi:hypothetical protein